jgi:uncharacterized membrane protein
MHDVSRLDRDRPPPATATQARRRYRYRRRHTPHFYLVTSGLIAAAGVCVLNGSAYASGSIQLAELAFVSVGVTNLIIFAAYFWGFYMAMCGRVPIGRMKILVPHACVGVLTPLLYTLNISLDIENLGTAPVTGLALVCSICCFALICLQYGLGKLMVRPEPMHLV